MKRFIFILIVGFCYNANVLSQDQNFMPNEFLLKLKAGYGIKKLMPLIVAYDKSVVWELPKQLIPEMDIWHLKFSGNRAHDENLRRGCGKLECYQIKQ